MDDVGNDDVGAMYSARTVVSDCKWGDGGKGGVGNGGRIATSLAHEYTVLCHKVKGLGHEDLLAFHAPLFYFRLTRKKQHLYCVIRVLSDSNKKI